jgi:hypothetical protein
MTADGVAGLRLTAMTTADQWSELHHCAGLGEARRIATTIAAMGFDVRVRDLGRDTEMLGDEAAEERIGPFVIETPAAQRTDLADVLAEIIDEQDEFDAALAERERRRDRQGRLVMWLILGAAAERRAPGDGCDVRGRKRFGEIATWRIFEQSCGTSPPGMSCTRVIPFGKR